MITRGNDGAAIHKISLDEHGNVNCENVFRVHSNTKSFLLSPNKIKLLLLSRACGMLSKFARLLGIKSRVCIVSQVFTTSTQKMGIPSIIYSV